MELAGIGEVRKLAAISEECQRQIMPVMDMLVNDAGKNIKT